MLFTLLLASFAQLLTAADTCGDGCGGSSHGPTAKPKTLEELFAVQCEHKIPQSACDECRYELGLVKLDPALLRQGGDTQGLVRIETVRKQAAQTFLVLNGEIALNETSLAHVSPRVSGTISTIKVELGQSVKAGDVLFEMESPELGLAISNYRKNKALAALALKNVEREKALAAQKLSPEADVVEAQMKYEEYRVEGESAEVALRLMGLGEETVAGLVSGRPSEKRFLLPVTAPQAGVVIQKHLDPGEAAASGKDVLTIANLATVWVWLNVYESNLALLTEEAKQGKPRVRVTVPAYPDRVFEGALDLIQATMNEETRTVKVRVRLANEEGVLRAGMFCTGQVVFDSPEQVLSVPLDAVVADEGKHFLFRLVRKDFALRTDVKIGRTFTDSVEVLQGVSEGDQIVGRGAFLLKSDVLREKMGAGCAD